MKLHPRYKIVNEAEGEFIMFLIELEKKYELTVVELLQILNASIGTQLKYALRSERHPDDPDKKGDEA